MPVLTANNAKSKLASSLSSGATSLAVQSGEGAKFPIPGAGEWFPLTLVKSSGVLEIVRCTARSGDVFTVTRAQESTSATAFDAGDRVELRLTAGALNAMLDERQPLDALLTAIAALTTAADKMPYFTGSDAVALTDLSAFMRDVLGDADAATARATLGANSATNLTTGTLPDARISASGPNSPTLVNGFTNGGACRYWKIGGIVYVGIDLARTTTPNNNTNAFTLPAGFRPAVTFYGVGEYGQVSPLALGISKIVVSTGGVVTVENNIGGTPGSTDYALSAMLAFPAA